MKALIISNDYKSIEHTLKEYPHLANEGIAYDAINTVKAHPLHRICDGVFAEKFTDEEAVKIAAIFLKYGANINGNGLVTKQDTPLIAAASLGMLFVRSLERSTGIHNAMLARGFNGSLPRIYPMVWKWNDSVWLALGLLGGVRITPDWISPVLMGSIVVALFVTDHPRLFASYRNKGVTLDSAIADEDELRRRLEVLFQAPIVRMKVKRVDLVNDTTTVEVRYRVPAEPTAGATAP